MFSSFLFVLFLFSVNAVIHGKYQLILGQILLNSVTRLHAPEISHPKVPALQ